MRDGGGPDTNLAAGFREGGGSGAFPAALQAEASMASLQVSSLGVISDCHKATSLITFTNCA